MGERHGDGGTPDRRLVHPAGSHEPRGDTGAGLEALLAAALREGAGDGGPGGAGEREAVAAFRGARDAGAYRARTRHRDDWRPRAQRRTRRSVKATVALFLSSLTLGGVAVAAIGTAGFSTDDHTGDRPRSSSPGSAPDSASGSAEPTATPPASGPAVPGGTESPDRPPTAEDAEARCRAYESVKDQGKALESTAWQRLVDAAGGEANVDAYCARQLASAADDAKGTQGEKGEPGAQSTASKAATAKPTANAKGKKE